MKWKPLALVVIACLGIAVPIVASGEGKNTTPALAATTPPQVAVPAPPPCTPLSTLYARSNWRDAHPLRGENPCPASDAAKLKRAFFLWREFRLVSPYPGLHEGDPYLTHLPIPAYIVECETRGYYGRSRWFARNGSGAQGPAQLLGWPAPNPATTPAFWFNR